MRRRLRRTAQQLHSDIESPNWLGRVPPERSLNLAHNGSDETVVECLTNENAALRREKDILSYKVLSSCPISGISHRESQVSTENGMTQFDSFEDWQQRINSRASTTRESDYEPASSHL